MVRLGDDAVLDGTSSNGIHITDRKEDSLANYGDERVHNVIGTQAELSYTTGDCAAPPTVDNLRQLEGFNLPSDGHTYRQVA